MIASHFSRQIQKSRHAAVAVMAGGGAAAYARLDSVTPAAVNPIVADVQCVAVETTSNPALHQHGVIMMQQHQQQHAVGMHGAAGDIAAFKDRMPGDFGCSAFATENDALNSQAEDDAAYLPNVQGEVSKVNSIAWQPLSVGQLPSGIICCPVLWPVWGMVPVDNHWNASPNMHINALPMSGNTGTQVALPLDIDASCRRTGTSRKQRRRQREKEGRDQASTEAASVLTAAAENSEDSNSPTYWPPTPESTPPQSPRLGFHLKDTEAPEMLEARASATLQQLSAASLDSAERNALVQQLVLSAWPIATGATGCRVLQELIDIADPATQAALAEQLHGHVIEATMSPHANFVLQKCIASLPNDRVRFVLRELKGQAVAASKSRSGCRVLERILEHFPCEETNELVDEVLGSADILCRHAFGNFVVQHILEHGAPWHQQQIVSVLCADAQRLARHRVASHVMKSALINGAHEDKQLLIKALSPDQESLSDLAHHHCGSFVVREMKKASSSVPVY
jgi:hypothetical protein